MPLPKEKIEEIKEEVKKIVKHPTLSCAEKIAHLSDFIKANDEMAILYIFRSQEYCNNNNFDDALDDCEKALKIDPNLALAYCHRGRINFKRGKFDDALTDYEKALKDPILAPAAYIALGNVNLKLGKNNEAITNYSIAIEKNPQYAKAYYYRCKTYLTLGNKEEALKDMEMLKNLDQRLYNRLNNSFSNTNIANNENMSVDKFSALKVLRDMTCDPTICKDKKPVNDEEMKDPTYKPTSRQWSDRTPKVKRAGASEKNDKAAKKHKSSDSYKGL